MSEYKSVNKQQESARNNIRSKLEELYEICDSSLQDMDTDEVDNLVDSFLSNPKQLDDAIKEMKKKKALTSQ